MYKGPKEETEIYNPATQDFFSIDDIIPVKEVIRETFDPFE